MLSDVCLSGTYIGPKSRTKRPRKTKIGTGSPRDLDTTLEVKRSSKVTGVEAYCGGLPHSLFECVFMSFTGSVFILLAYFVLIHHFISW